MPKLALCLIVKGTNDEAKLLDRCLSTIKQYVDGIFLYINTPEGVEPSKKVVEVAKKHKSNVTYGVWKKDFAEARNANFATVPKDYEWILWLDSDDTVEHPEKIADVLKMAANVDGIMVKYHYDTDEYGNTTTLHTNLRLVKNNGAFSWKGRLHETLIETRRVTRVRTEDFSVKHHANDARKDASNVRNITIMEQMLKDDGDSPDPRTLFYLGTAYIDAGMNDEALELLELYMNLSGWDEERAQASVWLGRIYRDSKQDISTAVRYFLHALFENPKEVTAFVEMGATEMGLEHWGKAIMWLEQAAVIKVPQSTALVINPLENTYKTYMMLAHCRLQLGGENITLAYKLAQEAYKIRPDLAAEDMVSMTKAVLKEKTRVESFVNAVKKLPKEKALIAYGKLEEEYRNNPAVLAIMRKFKDPKKWGKSVVIYCGNGVLSNWGPWSLEKGIGGSEEAVIHMSKQLKNAGYDVAVYANPGAQDGIYDGVEWHNYWEFDGRDEFDVLVIWRAPHLLEHKFTARKVYLWLHDVMEDEEFTPERLANVDKVMLLSKAHKTVFPSIPDDKVFYTGNGIEPDDFEQGMIEEIRDNHQVCYMSSYVRGLDNLLEIWPDVVKEVPDATLKICYGWESYDAVNRNNPERMAWKDKMIAKINSMDSVEELGRIGHKDIVNLTYGSGVWAYPTQFFEIYCITSVKAQAGGAWPVCTNFAALDEMVEYGYKQPMNAIDNKTPIGVWNDGELERYKQALIDALKNPPSDIVRKEMMQQARNKRSWLKTAQGWDEEFSR